MKEIRGPRPPRPGGDLTPSANPSEGQTRPGTQKEEAEGSARSGTSPGRRRRRSRPRRPARAVGGRPSKLTPELAERLCGLVGTGALLKDVAAACEVGEATVHEWMARGEGRDPDRPPTPEMERFARQVRLAMAGRTWRANRSI